MALLKEAWIDQIMEGFYPDSSFLMYARDYTQYVDNNKLHIAEAGADPNVMMNNTTYPIGIVQRTDTDIELTLHKFETQNTLVRRPEVIVYSYDQLESVIRGHRNSLRTDTAEYAAHAYAPQTDTPFTPVIPTTGADNGDGTKRIKIADILLLKRRFDDMDIPKEKRYLVLHPKHVEDLILQDMDSFKDITDFVNGKPRTFAGFQMLEYTKNPRYNKTDLTKIAYKAIPQATDTFCSFAFSSDEVMKADGAVYMYERRDDPELRGTVVGFDKRFVALPLRNKALGAIVGVDV